MPGIPLRCHFHNTRNTGLANAYAAVQAGVRTLDASLGGIGGCPFAPAATGNIPTEDLRLHAAAIRLLDTGISLDRAIETGKWLQEQLGRTGARHAGQGRRLPAAAAAALPRRPATRISTERRKRQGDSMTYRLGVDVGGTFTDLLLVNEKTGQTWKAKVSSTPADQSVGVLRGIERVCKQAGDRAEEIHHVMHGTTVATNTVLTGTGARVGLVTTKGYRQVLQIARSFVPGGLGGWVIYNKSLPMAPLALTIEADERVELARARSSTPLDEAKLRERPARARREEDRGAHRLADQLPSRTTGTSGASSEIAQEVLPGIPVSLSSEVVPEMQEYERTVTTVANSYVRPRVQKYVTTCSRSSTPRRRASSCTSCARTAASPRRGPPRTSR